jgi:hypothetical protein
VPLDDAGQGNPGHAELFDHSSECIADATPSTSSTRRAERSKVKDVKTVAAQFGMGGSEAEGARGLRQGPIRRSGAPRAGSSVVSLVRGARCEQRCTTA